MPPTAQTRTGYATTTRGRAPSVIWTQAEKQQLIDHAIRYRDETPQITAQTAIKKAMLTLPADRRRNVQSVQAPGKFEWFMAAWKAADAGPIRPPVMPAHVRPEAEIPPGSRSTVDLLREQAPPEPKQVAAVAPEVAREAVEPEEVPIDLMSVPPEQLLRAFEEQMRDRFTDLFTMMQEMNAMLARLGAVAFPGSGFPTPRPPVREPALNGR